MLNKTTVAAAVLLVSSSAFAVPQDLTFEVTANVPSANLSLTPDSGWSSIALPYDVVNTRLLPASKNLRATTNGSKDLEAWLMSSASMMNGTGDNITLDVAINDVDLGVGQASKQVILPAPTTVAPVDTLIPVTVTPASGTHSEGSYSGQVTVVYDLAP